MELINATKFTIGYTQGMGPDDPKEYGQFIGELCKEIVS